jgi:hypothetical protein
MEPTKELIEQLRREDIEQARAMTPEQRLTAGGELFDTACRWTLAGICRDHPGISDAEALQELRRRVALARKLEEIVNELQ